MYSWLLIEPTVEPFLEFGIGRLIWIKGSINVHSFVANGNTYINELAGLASKKGANLGPICLKPRPKRQTEIPKINEDTHSDANG
jgi:hypothetical protein